jgi:type IV secretory pathway VirJ component
MILARHEKDFRTNADAPLSLDELLALLEPGAEVDERSREDAIACFLSGGDGWRDAVKRLGGTFAEETKVKGS